MQRALILVIGLTTMMVLVGLTGCVHCGRDCWVPCHWYTFCQTD